MIRFAATRPNERVKSIEAGISMLKWDSDEYLNHYGIKVERNMTQVS